MRAPESTPLCPEARDTHHAPGRGARLGSDTYLHRENSPAVVSTAWTPFPARPAIIAVPASDDVPELATPPSPSPPFPPCPAPTVPRLDPAFRQVGVAGRPLPSSLMAMLSRTRYLFAGNWYLCK